MTKFIPERYADWNIHDVCTSNGKLPCSCTVQFTKVPRLLDGMCQRGYWEKRIQGCPSLRFALAAIPLLCTKFSVICAEAERCACAAATPSTSRRIAATSIAKFSSARHVSEETHRARCAFACRGLVLQQKGSCVFPEVNAQLQLSACVAPKSWPAAVDW